ncbi:SDR family NAD(P)-dependent oxidoreductase [Shewanella gelidimarina]|uniref:SDR family oxidoreductase n=1 Tax=Shewanella gelidimarina TaxID=56813 RepID=UPI002010353C|nr:SDR family NAD(P)-dependent oxidoreductase [Shewanella gelidimarina]MCL1059247.1 SDR family NAD(P)-dependent oxidoreductase [Shewanella gelidimarina]
MNKHAVVTGASKGIGKAVAKYLATQGYELTLIARNSDALNQVRTEIHSVFPSLSVDVHSIDLSDDKNAYEKLVTIAQTLNRIDIVFNNAGVFTLGTLDIDVDDFSNMIDINVKGLFIVAKAFCNEMKRQKHGYIFNLGSIAGKQTFATGGGYCASKYAVLGFNGSLHQELKPYNIKVTALCPGVVDTDMTKAFDTPKEQKMGTDEITKAIDYLLSCGPNTHVETLDLT